MFQVQDWPRFRRIVSGSDSKVHTEAVNPIDVLVLVKRELSTVYVDSTTVYVGSTLAYWVFQFFHRSTL